jgi:MATE family multidrug resistance protein
VAAAAALRGLKDTTVPMLLMIGSYWIVGIPLSIYLGIVAGGSGSGIWIGLITGLTVAAIALTLRFFGLTKLQPRTRLT